MTSTLYFTQANDPNLQQILVAMQFMGVNLKTQEINKKYDPLILLTPEGTITQPIAILQFLAKDPFAGHTQQEQLKVWEWFEQLNMELHPLLREIYEQVAGRRTADSDKFDYSLKELMRELDLINHHLKLRTFMVGDSVTLVDISLATHLETAFKKVIPEESRKKLPNLVRWFSFIRSTGPFVKVLGALELCGKEGYQCPKQGEKAE